MSLEERRLGNDIFALGDVPLCSLNNNKTYTILLK
jgi:hypothetical protein